MGEGLSGEGADAPGRQTPPSHIRMRTSFSMFLHGALRVK